MTTYFKQLQNAGPLLNIHQTSRLVWLGSGKICMALTVEFIYLAARLARQWIKERGIIVCALSVKFVYLAARWARREIVVTKTCRIIKTNGCYDQFLFIQTVLVVSHIRRSTSLRTQTYFRLLLVPPA